MPTSFPNEEKNGRSCSIELSYLKGQSQREASVEFTQTSGKTGRRRNWNDQGFKQHIHRVRDRRGHRVTARGSGVCESGCDAARTQIATLGISDCCRPVRANRGLDRSAARAVFHRKVKASNEKQS